MEEVKSVKQTNRRRAENKDGREKEKKVERNTQKIKSDWKGGLKQIKLMSERNGFPADKDVGILSERERETCGWILRSDKE